MNFSFETQGINTYLVYAVDPAEGIDSMSLGMLTNNHIPGLASAIFTQMDANKFIKYNVTAHISVKQFFSGYVNKKRLIGVFNGIVDAMLSAEDYMIDINSILLDLDYIFADVTTCETVLICLPIENKQAEPVDLGTFFKNIMFSTQFDPTEDCAYVAKIINHLNSTPVFSLMEFKSVLESVDGTAAPAPAQPKPQPVVNQAPVQQPAQPKPQPAVQPTAQPAPQQPVVQQQQPAPQQPVQPRPQVQVPPTPAASQVQIPTAGGSTPAPEQKKVPEKKMSLFNLLSNYSKENVEIYKAQKAAQQKSAPQAPAKKNNNPFEIPGASSKPTSFNIPGQAPVEAPKPVQPKPQQPAPQPAVRQPAPQPAVQQPVPQVQQPAPQQPAYQPQPAPARPAMNFGETTVLGGANLGETTVLGGAMAKPQATPHLIRIKNNEKININKPCFRIGKEKSFVDYFVGDNTAISRSHANIVSRDGEYFVVDTNSTNHTYVNGSIIQSNIEVKLSDGDKVRLANEEFEFKLN